MLSFDSVPPPWVLLCTTPGTVQSKSVILNLWIPTPLTKVTYQISCISGICIITCFITVMKKQLK